MKCDLNIDVHHLTRVEGHGNIHVKVKDGKLVDAKWAVVETPRFFEAMVRGLSHDLAPVLTARICGICSIGHALASLRAVERAMDVQIPKTAKKLRLLAKHGETLQSHILHVFFLVAPDFYNVGSVIPIVAQHPDVAGLAVRLKGLANDLCDLVAGRTTHPVSLAVGGLTKAPSKDDLAKMKIAIEERLPDMLATIDLFASLKMPAFVRETEFVSLKGVNEYPWIGGDLISTDGVVKPEDDYLAMTNEYVVDFSTSKFTKLSRDAFAAGALARFNNNHHFLHEKAREAAERLGLRAVNHNPFMNNVAQVVESYHVMLESIEMIQALLDSDLKDIRADYKPTAGKGVGAVEVPRGILYHCYETDDSGIIKKANCIIPTTQNNANIHYDLPELVNQEMARGKDENEIEKLCEMLVRTYDPCISCSVH
ncbi:nickel-dependent hydrogenase large subunit [Chloroherpeton thalassium ATCC 35110]|uniref:Nickel-dependent hydrogenase large subunit n=1 Tax=Chloroherpeton thalassium (strain ATCC 35110 / GB-78) TaxID=517418 RepID=B3QU17_CHLT3|nr:Ni/Fe hydrogenase subunit alpha [Chloroherpeton thalassium]ACF12815.1 nickel-dependent hydrogenase large subunit [Chloroherpeton thalassium ATCC 35110]